MNEKSGKPVPAAAAIPRISAAVSPGLLFLDRIFPGRLVKLVLTGGRVENDALAFHFRMKDEPAVLAADRALFIDRGRVRRKETGAERDSGGGKDKKEVFHGMDTMML
jgi:hypothetical protein